MSEKGQTLRALVTERLTAAAEEIFALVERTIAEYEEELSRSKEENQRLLEEALSPQLPQSTDAQIQTESQSEVLVLKKEEERSPVEEPPSWVTVKNENGNSDEEEVCEILTATPQTETSTEVHSPTLQQNATAARQNTTVAPRDTTTAPRDTTTARQNTPGAPRDATTAPQVTTAPRQNATAVPQITASPPQAALAALQTNATAAAPRPADQTTAVDMSIRDTAPQSLSRSNREAADHATKAPVPKRKRGRPRRLPTPSDPDDKNLQPFSKRSKDKPEGTQRGTAGTRGNVPGAPPTSSTQETKAEIKKDSPRTPPQSKCPKSRHYRKNLMENVARNMVFTNEKGEIKFRCNLCEKMYDRIHHLERHILVHTGERSFSCSVCDKTFRLKQHLMSHMAVHKDERLFGCPLCPRKFKRKDNLVRHIDVHTGDRPFGCSQCDVRFSLKKNLERHMKVHNSNVTYSCSVCAMKFSSPFYFKKHTKSHLK